MNEDSAPAHTVQDIGSQQNSEKSTEKEASIIERLSAAAQVSISSTRSNSL